MSAIVGMVRLDSAPLDTAAPARMLERLAHRAPDGRHVWSGERAVLGHGMLGTTRESLAERQPIHSRERGLVLVADARIDNRDELSANLGLPAPESAGLADSALILAAYEKWGIDC